MRYFDADALEFLGDLRRHNDRTWFNEHKERYERALREPFLEFIADAGPELRTISKNLVADPRPSGGSLFRIHRDVLIYQAKPTCSGERAVVFSGALTSPRLMSA